MQHHTRARARARGRAGEGEGDRAIGRLGALGRFWALIRAHLALRTSQGAKEPRSTLFFPRTGPHGRGRGHQPAQWLGRWCQGRGPVPRARSSWARPGPHDCPAARPGPSWAWPRPPARPVARARASGAWSSGSTRAVIGVAEATSAPSGSTRAVMVVAGATSPSSG